jgi:nucleoside-diphosphate kinase
MPRGDFSTGGCNGERGQEIEVECDGVWYAGLVDKCHDEGNFAVTYTDEGDWEDRVPGSRIRVGKGQEIKKAVYKAAVPTEEQVAEFTALCESAPPAAKGRPTPEAIKVMQAHGAKEKAFLAGMGDDSAADEKREVLTAIKKKIAAAMKKGGKSKGGGAKAAPAPAKAAAASGDPNAEQTYIMVKPDGVQRGLVGQIIARFERKGFKLVGLKLFSPPREHLENHYADLSKKGFFKGLIEYMLSGPVCCMVWEGMNAVTEGRKMLGATKPADSALGTIRGDFCIDVGRNLCHGSDAVESAQHEIALWFPEGLINWSAHSGPWVYENCSDAAPAAAKAPEKKTKPKKKEMAFIKFALTCSPSDNFDPLFAKIKADGEAKVHSLITSASYSMEPLAFGIENMMISFQFDVNGSCTGKPTAIHEVENWVDTLIGDDAGYGIQAKEQIGYDGPGL